MTIDQLKEFQDCTTVLHLTDGETLTARISFVDLEYDDIIVDILETSRPERYAERKSAYAVKARDIVSAERTRI